MSSVRKQINKCLRDLNVLKDLIFYEHWEEGDVDWEIDQVEAAKMPLEQLKEVERDAD